MDMSRITAATGRIGVLFGKAATNTVISVVGFLQQADNTSTVAWHDREARRAERVGDSDTAQMHKGIADFRRQFYDKH